MSGRGGRRWIMNVTRDTWGQLLNLAHNYYTPPPPPLYFITLDTSEFGTSCPTAQPCSSTKFIFQHLALNLSSYIKSSSKVASSDSKLSGLERRERQCNRQIAALPELKTSPKNPSSISTVQLIKATALWPLQMTYVPQCIYFTLHRGLKLRSGHTFFTESSREMQRAVTAEGQGPGWLVELLARPTIVAQPLVTGRWGVDWRWRPDSSVWSTAYGRRGYFHRGRCRCCRGVIIPSTSMRKTDRKQSIPILLVECRL